jgi:HAE1 family hydrophobic/amphiphilic exporter-1
MKLIETAVRRPVATVMVFVGVVLLGIISLRNLSIDLLPDLSYPKLSVLTEYAGASPEEIEKLITANLESVFAPIPGVKRVSSVSREGISLVSLEFHWGTDMNFALLHAKEKVEEARGLLPADCPVPRIIEMDPSSKPIIIAVVETRRPDSGGASLADRRETAELLVKPRLEQLDGVSRVDVQGSGEREVVVSVLPEKLALFGIGYEEVAAAIRNWNQQVLGGTVKKDNIRFVVKVEGEIQDPAQIEKIPLRALDAGHILIGDVARVRFAEKIKQGEIRLDRQPGIALMIYKEAAGNTVTATAAVRKAFRQMEKEFPELRFVVVAEESGLIVSAITNLKQALWQGGLLAFLVLLIFFQNWRDPILIAIISPISVLATFVLMFFAGVNLNIMSLGGLALGVGIFMDNAIVVIENMYRFSFTEDAERSAILATRELLPALLGSSLTTIVIFLPVIYIYGITGRLFRDQALTISFALTAALVVTVTLLPTLFKVFSPGKKTELKTADAVPGGGHIILRRLHQALAWPLRVVGFVLETILAFLYASALKVKRAAAWVADRGLGYLYRVFNRGYEAFSHWYHAFLLRCLERKAIAAWIALGMLAGTVIFYLPLKKELLPQTRTARFEISASSDPSLGYEETETLGNALESKFRNIPSVTHVFSRFGTTSQLGIENADISVNRLDWIIECRGRGQRDPAMKAARRILAATPALAQQSVFPEKNTLSEYLRFGADEFQVNVYYERIADGRQAVREITSIMKTMPQLVDVRSNDEEGKPILAMRINEELLNRLRISKKTIAETIRNALRGDQVSTLKRLQKSYDIVVSTPIRDDRELRRVLDMPIVVNGSSLILSQLIRFERVPSIKELARESQERYFQISANLQGIKSQQAAVRLQRDLKRLALPAGVRIRIAGEEEERRAAFSSVGVALLLSILLVYMVMAAEFENLIHPLLIMSTVPMGMFGAFFALLLLGETINVISAIGMMMAVGIVVDDAIVKVEYANQMRKEGRSVRESLLEASRVRLKPIILNTFTTVFGVLPMIYMSGVGAELQRPMAVVLAGSLLSSTILTLVLIPVLYEIFTHDKVKA